MVWLTLARHLMLRPSPVDADPGMVQALRERLTRPLGGRSLAIRHVAAGSCNACELELRATQNMIHDLTRYGLSFTPSPRHADVLLITGVGCRNMQEAVLETREAMPEPALVVAVGDCAVDGGVFKGSPAVLGGAGAILEVDLFIAGCPPTPRQVVEGLLTLIEAQEAAAPGLR